MLQRLPLLVCALLVALAAAVPSGRWYHCRMDGALHASCCCVGSAQQATDPDRPCSSHGGGCCTIVILPDHPDQQTAATLTVPDDGNAVIASLDTRGPGLLLVDLSDRTAGPDRPPRSCAPLRSAPQLYQRFCSYLI